MHRSGTSAITGALGVLDVPLGLRLIDAGPDNPGGYWEQRDTVLLDEQLLHALGSDWDDPTALPASWLDGEPASEAAAAIRALVADEFSGKSLWALKDPRLCRLLPLWRQELLALGVQPSVVLVLRHPDEIAASLRRRDALPATISHLLTIRYLLDAERASRGLPRSVVSYDRVLEEPATAFARIAVDLLLLWPQPPDRVLPKLDAFLDPEARHHREQALDSAARDAAGLDSPFRAAALELHALLEQGVFDDAGIARLDAFADQFEKDLSEDSALVQRIIDESRLRRDMRENLRQKFADASAQLQQQLRDTEAAQQRAEALSMQRAEEMEQLTTRLREVDGALAQRESESRQRLSETEQMGDALIAAQRAQAQREEESRQRLADAERLDRALADAHKAQAEATALAVDRMAQVQRLDAALAEAQQLDRQRSIQAEHLDAALGEAQQLAEQRLHQLGELDAQLGATQAGLAQAESLCAERERVIDRLTSELESDRQRSGSTSQHGSTAQGWSPFRALARWWRSRGGSDGSD
ncbi:MAG: hypothetical protein ABIQ97_00305 [Lysobacteraceae bacterium]